MRKGIHPLMKRLTLVTSQGASSTIWSTMSARRGQLILQTDPSNHPAWTGRKAAVANTGRVARFRQRFEADAAASAQGAAGAAAAQAAQAAKLEAAAAAGKQA